MTECFASAQLARRIVRAAEAADRDGLLGEIRAIESVCSQRLAGAKAERLELLQAVTQDMKVGLNAPGGAWSEWTAHLELLRHLAGPGLAT